MRFAVILAMAFVEALGAAGVSAAEPPALNPFGPVEVSPGEAGAAKPPRDDAIEGCVEMSDGARHAGWIFLTRDARLKILDESQQRQREIPLSAVARIDCHVKREWMEREWTFKETTSDEKIYTGRSYPAREYLHTITLHDGRKIVGPLSAIVYVQPAGADEARRFILHKRDKGRMGQELKSLVYVKSVVLRTGQEKKEK